MHAPLQWHSPPSRQLSRCFPSLRCALARARRAMLTHPAAQDHRASQGACAHRERETERGTAAQRERHRSERARARAREGVERERGEGKRKRHRGVQCAARSAARRERERERERAARDKTREREGSVCVWHAQTRLASSKERTRRAGYQRVPDARVPDARNPMRTLAHPSHQTRVLCSIRVFLGKTYNVQKLLGQRRRPVDGLPQPSPAARTRFSLRHTHCEAAVMRHGLYRGGAARFDFFPFYHFFGNHDNVNLSRSEHGIGNKPPKTAYRELRSRKLHVTFVSPSRRKILLDAHARARMLTAPPQPPDVGRLPKSERSSAMEKWLNDNSIAYEEGLAGMKRAWTMDPA